MDEETAASYVLLDFELIALIVLVSGVAVYALARRLRRGGGGWAERPAGDFDGFDLVLMFFPAMLFLLNPVAEALMAGRAEEGPPSKPGDHGILTLLMNFGYFIFVGVMTFGIIEWVRNRSVASLFGLRRLRLANIVVVSILGGVLSVLLCGWLVGDFSNRFLEDLFVDLDVQEPVRMLRDANSSAHLVLSIAMACVAAPLVEELLFRGYMYGTLRELTHPVFAAVVIGALFAVVHGNLPALLPLWVFSLLLTTAYELTRCLWVPVGMHIFFNAANIVLMMSPGAGE